MTDPNLTIGTSRGFEDAQRKPVNLHRPTLVEIDHSLSLTAIRPSMPATDLAVWLADNREMVQAYLYKHGALLLRGFELNSKEDFERVFDSVSTARMNYMEGATPRKELGDRIYTSTSFPSEQRIALHNELSYVVTWPMRICFCCLRPADDGGETPVADTRHVLQHIDREILNEFEKRGWMLVRNFREGLSLPWQTAFRVSKKEDLEDYCRSARINCEWLAEGGLRTKQIRPAVTRHPKTDEPVWFNHIAFWHVSSLESSTRDLLLEEFGEDALPYNTYYGDGERIEEAVIQHLQQAYDRETVLFSWRAGDVLLLDNMLSAHGRQPFKGHRTVLVAMGDPFTRTDL